jgi:hypothetical protein
MGTLLLLQNLKINITLLCHGIYLAPPADNMRQDALYHITAKSFIKAGLQSYQDDRIKFNSARILADETRIYTNVPPFCFASSTSLAVASSRN